MHYFLCDMGVTQVNDLCAILPINPCQVLLHTSCIPLLRWFTLWPHEVMRATRLSILHMYKKSSWNHRWCWVLFTCMMERADKDTGQHQLYGPTCTLPFCFSQRRTSRSQVYWPVITTLHPYMDFCGRSAMFPIHGTNVVELNHRVSILCRQP